MSRGINRERQVREVFESHGWVVVRAAGSLGFADLVGLKAGERPILVEVKSTIGPYDHFGPADRADLLAAAAQAGADAMLAWWPSRGKLKFVWSSEWPARLERAA